VTVTTSNDQHQALKPHITEAGKSTVLAKTLRASITTLLTVVKAVLVHANCVSQDAARSVASLASIAATRVASHALACLCKV
jgi:pectin methylesterase-like acyl-CoA thioesterase